MKGQTVVKHHVRRFREVLAASLSLVLAAVPTLAGDSFNHPATS